MSVITISRSYGINMDELLKDFSNSIGYNFISGEILEEVAKRADKPLEELKEYYSMEKFSTLKVFISEMLQSIPRTYSFMATGAYADNSDLSPLYYPQELKDPKLLEEHHLSYLETVNSILKEVAAQKNIIIVGRGGQVVFQDNSNAIHFRIEADLNYRIQKVIETENISKDQALSKIKQIDKSKEQYINYFYGKDIHSIELYHYILNISKIGEDSIIDSIKNLL